MPPLTNRRKFLMSLALLSGCLLTPARAQQKTNRKGTSPESRHKEAADFSLPGALAEFDRLSLVLGRIGDRSATLSLLAREPLEVLLDWSASPAGIARPPTFISLQPGEPAEFDFTGLLPNTAYEYHVQWRRCGETSYRTRAPGFFQTQRPPGATFSFSIQGDSHPERPQMSDPVLYAQTLQLAAASRPDFHLCMGDDFSVEKLHTVTPETVRRPYELQRPFLGLIAQSAPLFLLNGNHEQASLFNYQQNDERRVLAIAAQNARRRYFPQPEPGGIYGGDSATLAGIGPLRDYHAWTWGDALFVILDNYWHSPALVDNGFHERDGGGKGSHDRDWWGLTLGETQYQWFRRTLEQSRARFKFVFAHHVLGTGRGGIEQAGLYEWGGADRHGSPQFAAHRPGWALPVHPLMVRHGVTIFFQGHDHLFARQERDGIIYQTVPMPADPAYATYNEARYQSGLKLPNSGYLRVTVSPQETRVDYLRSYLPKDETAQRRSGEIACSYRIASRDSHA